jgi:hypothetical protein
VTITGGGSCTITASQPGDSNYLAATNVPQTFPIAKANQTITFGPLPDKTTSDPPFTVNATASSGLTVSFAASGNCTVSGNTVTITSAGSCTITASQSGNVNYNAAADVPRSFNITSGGGGSGTSAAFIRSDTTTQGNWHGVYGSQGYGIVADTFSYPSYAQVTVSGASTWVWASSTSDVRALQKASGLDRIASCWYTDPSPTFSIDINLTDGVSHQVAIYGVDWDGWGRLQTIDVLDAATGAVLDSRTMSAFSQGQYLAWSVRGHVVLRLTNARYPNGVISGLFFD